MSTVIVRPDATLTGNGILTGGATFHAVLADNSDASYARMWPELSPTVVDVGSPTKPAGSVTKQVRVRVRASSISVNQTRISWWFNHAGAAYGVTSRLVIAGTTAVEYTGPWTDVGDLSQASLDALTVSVDCDPLNTEARFYEAYLDVLFAEVPSTTVTAPSGALGSSTIDAAWTHTPGTDGGGQAAYEIKAFTDSQYGAVGFDPSTSVAVFAPGIYYLSSTVHSFALGAGTYRVYVRTAQSTNGVLQWAAWDYNDITISFGAGTTPEIDAVTAAPDPDSGRVEIVVDRDVAGEAWSAISLERNVAVNQVTALGLDGGFESGGGGTTAIAGTVSADVPAGFTLTNGGGTDPAAPAVALLASPTPWDGTYWRMGGTFDAGDRLLLDMATSWFPVVGGDEIVIGAMAHSTLGADCAGIFNIAWFDAAETFMYSTEAAFAGEAAWRRYTFRDTAPAEARFAKGGVSIRGETGASAAACIMAVDDFGMYRNDEWVAVRGAADVTPPADQATFFDYEVPPDTATRYRARAVAADGTIGNWTVYTAGTVEWTFERGVWVTPVEAPHLKVKVAFAAPPARRRKQRRGVFEVAREAKPTVIADVRSAREDDFVFQTVNEAEANGFIAAVDYPVLLVQCPATSRFDSGYWSFGEVEEVHLDRWIGIPHRRWRVSPATEVLSP